MTSAHGKLHDEVAKITPSRSCAKWRRRPRGCDWSGSNHISPATIGRGCLVCKPAKAVHTQIVAFEFLQLLHSFSLKLLHGRSGAQTHCPGQLLGKGTNSRETFKSMAVQGDYIPAIEHALYMGKHLGTGPVDRCPTAFCPYACLGTAIVCTATPL